MTRAPSPVWKRFLRFSLFSAAVLAALCILSLVWLHLSGEREWTATQKDLLARGEKLALVELAPPKIPDEENFFADPMWDELSDLVAVPGENGASSRQPRLPKGKRQLDAIDPPLPTDLVTRGRTLFPYAGQLDSSTTCQTAARTADRQLLITTNPTKRTALAQLILDALASSQPLRRHIEQLLLRPGARFPVDYEAGLAAPLPHLDYLLKIDQSCVAEAHARLALDQPGEAAHDVLMNFELADKAGNEPLLISALVKAAIFENSLSLINSGIRAHAWRDADLVSFDSSLRSPALPAILAQALRGERGAFNQLTIRLQSSDHDAATRVALFPGSADLLHRFRLRAESLVTLSADRAFYNRAIERMADDLSSRDGVRPSDFPSPPGGTISHFTHRLSLSAIDGIRHALLKILSVQDEALQTRIACALERYWLKNHTYPDSLAALSPDYLPQIPTAPLAGQTFHYRREAPDRLRLWSNGWNETDEQGVVSKTRRDLETGDWVWDTLPGSKR